ncbi:MAG TPA: DUF2911 domain-containing protein [Terriglobales bacterium]
MKKTAVVLLFILSFTLFASAQQDKSKRPSPPAQAKCSLQDGKTITVDYSSPRLKGRKVGGEVAPFGQVWRTGANEATTFVTTADFTIDGKDIPAGNYTLFTLPEEQKWTLIINKKTGEWGIPYKWESEELLRAPMQVSNTSGPVEDFTISFEPKGNACTMHLDWGNTRASATFTEKK